MRTRSFPFVAIAITIVVVLAVIFLAVSRFQPSGIAVGSVGPSAQATPIHHYGAESGAITATLISPDNVSFQIVQIQKGPAKWLFHIHAHNNAKSGVAILNASTSHYFALSLRGVPGRTYTFDQLTVKLTAPTQVNLGTHLVLSTTVMPSMDADGWLMADLSHTTFPPIQLIYVYGTVTAPACSNPLDQSTCHPSTGYRVLVWNL